MAILSCIQFVQIRIICSCICLRFEYLPIHHSLKRITSTRISYQCKLSKNNVKPIVFVYILHIVLRARILKLDVKLFGTHRPFNNAGYNQIIFCSLTHSNSNSNSNLIFEWNRTKQSLKAEFDVFSNAFWLVYSH